MLNRTLPIVIGGGGPAGSSLAIRLAIRGYAVVLVEREKFPREKLCGQFISPECFPHFEELGVLDEMFSAGGERVTQTRFFARGGRSVSVPSRLFGGGDFALSLSRARMDTILLDRARTVGVNVIEQAGVTAVLKENGRACGVRIRTENGDQRNIASALVVDATGRRRAVTRLVEKSAGQASATRPRFVGLKANFRNVGLPAGTCEIYSFRGGYAGLSNIEDGAANLCLLSKSSVVREWRDPDRVISEVLLRNKRARATLHDAGRLGDWLAVSIDGFGLQYSSPLKRLVSVGDAAAFIDPFTGSGILMAFEGSEALCDSLVRRVEYTENDYSRRLYAKFKLRLRVSHLLRRAAFDTRLAWPLVATMSASTALSSSIAAWTRPAVSGRT